MFSDWFYGRDYVWVTLIAQFIEFAFYASSTIGVRLLAGKSKYALMMRSLALG